MSSNAISYAKAMGKILLLSYGLTVLFLAGLAFLMYQMKLGADQATWGITAIYFLGGGLSGFLMGKRAGSRRLFWGLLMGMIYVGVLMLLSLFLGGGLGPSGGITRALAVCLVGSAVGSVLS